MFSLNTVIIFETHSVHLMSYNAFNVLFSKYLARNEVKYLSMHYNLRYITCGSRMNAHGFLCRNCQVLCAEFVWKILMCRMCHK